MNETPTWDYKKVYHSYDIRRLLLCSNLENQNDNDHKSKSFTFLMCYLRLLCIFNIPKALNRQWSQKEKLLKLLIGPFVMNVLSLLALERSFRAYLRENLNSSVITLAWGNGLKEICLWNISGSFLVDVKWSSDFLCCVPRIDDWKPLS